MIGYIIDKKRNKKANVESMGDHQMIEQKKENIEISFIELNDAERKALLDVLDYEVDEEGFVVNKRTKKPHICPFSNTKVPLSSSSILPGSTVIINTSALTLSEYFSRYLEER